MRSSPDRVMARRAATPEHRPVGLVGLGLMGSAVGGRLLGAGFEVVGWDIDGRRRGALRRAGGAVADGAEDVFRRCQRVLLSLPDAAVSRAVLGDVAGELRRGHLVADTSTGDPADAVALHRELARAGAAYLDATVSGSSVQVGRGEVLVMAGGPAAEVRRCRDLFGAFAAQVVHTGPAGSAAQMKLVTNLVLGLNRAALAEGLGFARAVGLDPSRAFDVLRSSMAYSRIMDTKGPKMLRGDFRPQARLTQHLKDVRLMLAAAGAAGAALPLSRAHARVLEAAVAAGLGELDNSAIIRVVTGLGWKP